MGAVTNQAPELWGAVLAGVPFVDVINTMVDETLPLTPGEWPEWGNPITDKAAFDYMLSYSPYDNVTAKAYPRSEEHTSELQSLMRISYAVFCLKKQITTDQHHCKHKLNQPTH